MEDHVPGKELKTEHLLPKKGQHAFERKKKETGNEKPKRTKFGESC